MIVTTTTVEALDTRSLAMTNSEILQAVQAQRTKCTVWSRVMGYPAPSRALTSAKRASIESAYFLSKILTRQKNALKKLNRINTRSDKWQILTMLFKF